MGPPPPARGRLQVGSGNREDGFTPEAGLKSHQGDFKDGGVFQIAHEQIADPAGIAVRRPAGRNTDLSKTMPTVILHRSEDTGRQDFKHVYRGH